MARILGIDPGPSICGWGLVDSSLLLHLGHGVFKTPKDANQPQRLMLLYDQLALFLRQYRPDAASIERLFFGRATTQILGVVEARGVILLACHQLGIPTYDYPPQTIKKAVTGSGTAPKKLIQAQVALYFGLEAVPKPDDAADALAAAICHIQHEGLDLSSIER